MEKEDKVFQIQTEFYHRPHPKITSTVILDGEIINKVDTPWQEKLTTDEDLKKIEKALRKQHQSITQTIENKVAKVSKTHPKETPLMKSWKRLSRVEGIENLVVADAQGEILYPETKSRKMKAILKVLHPATKLATFLSRSTSLGNFLGGQLTQKKERVAWVYKKDRLWGTLLNQNLDFESFLEKTKQTMMERKIE